MRKGTPKDKPTSKDRVLTYRKCMNYEECKTQFYSEGNYNRLCNICRKKDGQTSHRISW